MGRGLFWVFSTTDFFSSASRIGHISSPCALPRERWPRNRRLLTVFTGLRLPLGYHDHLGIFVKIAWAVCPPPRRVTCGIEIRSRDLDRKGQHFSPPVLLLSFPLSLLSCCGSVFHFDVSAPVHLIVLILSISNFSFLSVDNFFISPFWNNFSVLGIFQPDSELRYSVRTCNSVRILKTES